MAVQPTRRSSRTWWVLAGVVLVSMTLLALVPWWAVPRMASAQSQGSGMSIIRRMMTVFGWRPPQRYLFIPDELPLMGWHGHKLQLLERQSVQTELRLTDQQKSRVESTLWSLRRRGPELRLPPVVEPPAMHSPEWKQLMQRQRKLEQAIRDTLQRMGTFLTAAQMNRLHQIALQLDGTGAFNWYQYGDELCRELKVTPQQRQRMRSIARRTLDQREQLWQSGGPGADPVQQRITGEKVDQLNNREQEELLAVLTNQQRARWKAMLGPKASFIRRIGDPRGSF